MKARPTQGRLVVRPAKGETQSPGGIIIPDNVLQNQMDRGEVIAAGEGVYDCVKGDTIIYNKYGGQTIKVDDEDLMILKEEDVLLVVEDEED